MHAPKHPYAVRLIGFGPDESAQLATLLTHAPPPGPAYFCLLDDSLQEPDVYIANGDQPETLARLERGCSGPLQPALVVGGGPMSCAWPRLARPVDATRVHTALAELMSLRAQQLALACKPGHPIVIDRRRHPRLDDEDSEPGAWDSLRQPPPCGAVLIIDKGGAFRDHVAEVLGARKRPVEWTDSGPTAVRLCEETPVSLVIINTSTPGIDPYALTSAIKSEGGAARTAVIFLVNASFPYDSVRARDAGVRGLLDKPVADRHLVAALHKLLSLPA
jgi:CheY-like chemotaxis protein